MTNFTSVFVAVLAAVRFAGVVSFTGLSARSSSTLSYRSDHVSSRSRSGALCSTTTPFDASYTAAAPVATISMPHRARWCSRLGASGETSGAEGEAVSEESASASVEAQSAAGGAGVDLSKGIAFEAPKPKTVLEPEEEEESESKKIRVILYTVLSLVPFVLLIPFLGSRELMPLDPSQM